MSIKVEPRAWLNDWSFPPLNSHDPNISIMKGGGSTILFKLTSPKHSNSLEQSGEKHSLEEKYL